MSVMQVKHPTQLLPSLPLKTQNLDQENDLSIQRGAASARRHLLSAKSASSCSQSTQLKCDASAEMLRVPALPGFSLK